jgi:hypothetical protein
VSGNFLGGFTMNTRRPWLAAGCVAVLTSCTGSILGHSGDPGAGNPGSGPPATGMAGDLPSGVTVPGTTPPTGLPMPAGSSPNPGMPAAAAIGTGRLRQLTQAQFENSLRDLLGLTTPVAVLFSNPDEGFASVASSYASLTDATIDQYHNAIKTLLTPYFADATLRKGALADCTPANADDSTCFSKFVAGFGRRAWRRPLTTAEIDRTTKLAGDAARALGDPWKGLAYATAALLESPNFIYRVELGVPDPGAGGRYRYTGFETASRLSYFLTGSTPDVELLTAAEGKQLETPEGIRSQAQRLLGSERGKLGITNFAREYMQLDNFVAEGSGEPRYTESLRIAMRDEVLHLFEGRLAAGSDTLDLLDTTQAFVNAELAAIYEIPGITSKTPVEAALPAGIPRAGILGTGAFLAHTSIAKMEEKSTSPTARGVYVNETVLCRSIPPPPAGVKPFMPAAGATLTKREYLDLHRADPGCAACHGLFDPIGFAFENFDWVGANRKLDQGKPVDTTGSYEGYAFKDAKDMIGYLKKQPDTQRCFVQNLFRYANGHEETATDAPIIDGWNQEFGRQNRNWSKFLTEMVASNDFKYVN